MRLRLPMLFGCVALIVVVLVFRNSPESTAARTALQGEEAPTREPMGVVPPGGAETAVASHPQRETVRAAPADWHVLVLDSKGEPARAATIAWTRHTATSGYESLSARERRAWSTAPAAVDDRGLAQVPRSTTSVTVFAQQAGEWGCMELHDATPQPAELRLQPDRTVRARVLDEAGRPVSGVRVSLRENSEAPGFGGDFVGFTAGPQALAEFAHVQRILPQSWRARCVVMLDVPMAQPIFAAVDLTEVPELVTLRLPTAGSLRVRLITASGPFRPLGTETGGVLYCALAGAKPQGRTTGGGRTEFELRVAFPDAELVLPRIGLSLHCRLVMDGSECAGAIEFAGPTTAGQQVDIEMLVQPMPVLTGRMVDERGTPQRGAWDLRQIQDTAGWQLQPFETGEDGRFVLRLAQPPLPDEERGLLFEAMGGRATKQAFTVVARSNLHDGSNDLGDLLLAPPPVLVAGRVVDQNGKGIPAARLVVVRTRDDTTWGLPNVDRDTRTAADGSFVVQAHALRRELRLIAFKAERAGEEMPFQPPAQGVVYLLPAVGTLTAALTCSGSLQPNDLWLALRERATGRWLGRASRWVVEAGNLRWEGLLPGRYDFEIAAVGVSEPLWRTEVEIAPDAVTALPPIRLGDASRALTIRVVDERGVAIPDASLVVEPDDRSRPRTALRRRDGVFALTLHRLPVDALVVAPGYRSLRVSGLAEDRTLRLAQGFAVALHATVAPPLSADERLVPRLRRITEKGPATPEPALRLDAHVDWFIADHDERLWQSDKPLDRDGRVQLLVPAPGEYEIEWWLDAWRDFSPAGVPAQRFTVRDAAAETGVEVRVTLPPRTR